MITKRTTSTKAERATQRMIWVAGVISLVLLTVLAISSVFFRKFLDESQDVRDSAAVKNGIVSLVGPQDSTNYPLSAGVVSIPLALTPSTASGQNVQTNGLEVSFDISGPLKGAPSVSLAASGTNSYLKIAAIQVTPYAGTPKYHVNAIIIPENPAKTLQISRYTPILLVSFAPSGTGSGTISFDQSLTRVITFKSTADILNVISAIQFAVVDDNSITPSPISDLRCEWCGSQCVPVGSHPTCAKTLGPISGNCQPNAKGTACEIVKTSPTPTSKLSPTPTKKPIPTPSKRPGATPPVRITLTPTPTGCAVSCASWGECQSDGYQYRSCSSGQNCPKLAAPVQRRQCKTQCTYNYSAWSQCSNGWQTRGYNVQPAGCFWYETMPLEELGRSCAPTTSVQDFKTYTYEACWYGNTSGNALYFMWKESQIAGATWLDVSTSPDFSVNFANKNLSSYPLFTIDGYLATNGSGFMMNGKTFTFSPGVRYYLRLWNGTKHSNVISLYMPQCQGSGGPTLRYCNESCANNSECAPNLFCNGGVCRHPSNPSNEYCTYASGDNGLNRACNEYCSDNKECASGKTCWWNRCRNPLNVESTSCDATNLTVTTNNCNAACTSNNQCGTNFRCYYGVCRLATNPLSSSCGAYSQALPEKGDTSYEDELVTTTPAAQETATDSTDAVTPTVVATADELETDPTQQKEELTAWDSLWNWLEAKGISPFALAGLLLLGILALFLASNRRRPPTPPQAPMPGKVQPPQTVQQTAPTMQQMSAAQPQPLRPLAASPYGQPLNTVPQQPTPLRPAGASQPPTIVANPNNPLTGPSRTGLPTQPPKLS